MGNWLTDTWKDLTQPGWRQAKEAADLQRQALGAEQSAEAWRQGQAKELSDLAQDFLWGRSPRSLTEVGEGGKPAPFRQGDDQAIPGAASRAEDWMGRYLDFLQNSPDTTYNLQRGSLERGYQTGNAAVTRALRARGLDRSGMLGRGLGDLRSNRARALADLIGQREDRRGSRLEAGTQATQAMLDRALNLFTGAKGAGMGLDTRIPGLLSQMAGTALLQPQGGGVVQDLIGAWVDRQSPKWFGGGSKSPPAKSSKGSFSSATASGSAGVGGGSPLSSAAWSFARKALGLPF